MRVTSSHRHTGTKRPSPAGPNANPQRRIIGNQCGRYEVETFSFHGYDVQIIPTGNEGGLNRNHIWMRADADICLFADDDVRYDDHYAEKILTEFSKHPEADVLLFNFHCKNKTREEYIIRNGNGSAGTTRSAMGPIGSRSVPSASAAPTSLSLFCLAVAPGMAPGRTASFCTTVSGMASKLCMPHLFRRSFPPGFHLVRWVYAKILSRQRRPVRHLFPRLAKPFCLAFLVRHPSFRTNGFLFGRHIMP